MKQLIFENKIYIWGKSSEVLRQLKEISLNFNTIKEYIDFKLDLNNLRY